ncbi:hypothetical protein BGZ99_009275 [Dissophora globulifera]|uniref:Peptidase S9 prolyl oligopeptidase catalytic domain-containing protein n=1 Tax=Dissophora globulifera TaxID=979702 RepID=A0A9P6R9Q7_9FUNG|nr:hypothetical protein BGZ99_009275 [Dissophora globulifera]
MKIHSAVAWTALIDAMAIMGQCWSMPSHDQVVFRQEFAHVKEISSMVPPLSTHADNDDSTVKVHPTWQVLGPFPTGMREQDFGADPLEAFGGFRSLPYDKDAKFPSELAKDGVVQWHTTEMDEQGWVHVLYPDIDWKFNQQFLGWAFNQFQAWARTSFTVPESCGGDDGLCSVTLQCTNVGDFYVDNDRLSGDWYGYGLTRHTLRLQPGSQHTISVRVVHEVRIFGGITYPPPSQFMCEFVVVPRSLAASDRHVTMVQVVKEGSGSYVLMDAVDDILAGQYISVALRNAGPERVVVKSVAIARGSQQFKAALKDMNRPISLFPSTHRPIAILLERIGDSIDTLEFSLEFELETTSSDANVAENRRALLETDLISIDRRTWGEPYKYTFLDVDGTVHYAAAIPPSDPSSQPADSAPVLVALHGAGVEVAQSPFWLSEYQQRERTWIVLPTGRTPWGYDWHGASIKNVFSAIQSLAESLPGVPEISRSVPGMVPDPERLFMAGHSNGGQGAWYMVTHFPDLAIAATPVAGYVNIKQYVPFLGWLSNSYTDAHLRGILESSIAEFDNDVHIPNTVGVSILARTGSIDDNVPPFSSRKMVRLGQENAHNLSAISLSEVPERGHWYSGIMHDEVMQAFLKQHLHDNTVQTSISGQDGSKTVAVHPPFPSAFEITVINPAGMGSKGGIQIEQLRIPYRKGTIKVRITEDSPEHDVGDNASKTVTWTLQTTNIRRLRFLDSPSLQARRGRISKLIIDGVHFSLGEHSYPEVSEVNLTSGTFVQLSGLSSTKNRWTFNTLTDWVATERHRETYGPAIQLLEKRVVIVVGTQFDSESAAVADRIIKIVAHDIYLYGRGDVEVFTDEEYLVHLERSQEEVEQDRTNIVLVGDSYQNSVTRHVLAQTDQEVIIDSQKGVVSIQAKSVIETASEFQEPGTGVLMIRPWGTSNLAMVIAGLDAQGLETAARLFPKRTGLLVPDWVITGPEMSWKGAGGILAAGYWGNHWEYQPLMSV